VEQGPQEKRGDERRRRRGRQEEPWYYIGKIRGRKSHTVEQDVGKLCSRGVCLLLPLVVLKKA